MHQNDDYEQKIVNFSIKNIKIISVFAPIFILWGAILLSYFNHYYLAAAFYLLLSISGYIQIVRSHLGSSKFQLDQSKINLDRILRIRNKNSRKYWFRYFFFLVLSYISSPIHLLIAPILAIFSWSKLKDMMTPRLAMRQAPLLAQIPIQSVLCSSLNYIPLFRNIFTEEFIYYYSNVFLFTAIILLFLSRGINHIYLKISGRYQIFIGSFAMPLLIFSGLLNFAAPSWPFYSFHEFVQEIYYGIDIIANIPNYYSLLEISYNLIIEKSFNVFLINELNEVILIMIVASISFLGITTYLLPSSRVLNEDQKLELAYLQIGNGQYEQAEKTLNGHFQQYGLQSYLRFIIAFFQGDKPKMINNLEKSSRFYYASVNHYGSKAPFLYLFNIAEIFKLNSQDKGKLMLFIVEYYRASEYRYAAMWMLYASSLLQGGLPIQMLKEMELVKILGVDHDDEISSAMYNARFGNINYDWRTKNIPYSEAITFENLIYLFIIEMMFVKSIEQSNVCDRKDDQWKSLQLLLFNKISNFDIAGVSTAELFQSANILALSHMIGTRTEKAKLEELFVRLMDEVGRR